MARCCSGIKEPEDAARLKAAACMIVPKILGLPSHSFGQTPEFRA